MKGYQPAERIWAALKETATLERSSITLEQALKRVRKIAAKEGMGGLPEPALRFYANEYVRMVRGE
jgi:hypothetical protein